VSRIGLIGNLAVDRVAGGAPRVGGGVFHAARAAARIGADVVAVTRCADGDREVALAPLEALGFPVTCGDATETTAFSFHYEGDLRVMQVDAVGDGWTADDVDGWAGDALADCSWVLVAGLLRSHFERPAIEALGRRDGHSLLLDAQGITRLARIGSLVEDGDVDRGLLSHLTVLKLNEEEGETLAGGLDADRLASLGPPEIVLTLGSQGARVVADGTMSIVPPHPATGPVDPTGAGDAFSLVYVDGRARGLEPAEAAERAARVVTELITVT
jgi:sugar/nucleoside kinase (ribokinase family)